MTILDKKIGTADFITRLADKGYTKKDSAVIVGDVLDVFYEAFRNGEDVSLTGFGKFSIKQVKPRRIYNISLKKYDIVPPYNTVKFTPWLALRKTVEALDLAEE